MFSKEYLQFLYGLELCDYYLEKSNGQYILEFFGPWSRVTYSETLALAIISELNTHAMLRQGGWSKNSMWQIGQEKLQEKIKILKRHPGIIFADFGHRRRASSLRPGPVATSEPPATATDNRSDGCIGVVAPLPWLGQWFGITAI